MKKLVELGAYYRKSPVLVAPRIEEGGELAGELHYIVETHRLDKRWRVDLRWVGLDKSGNHVIIPHEVIEALQRHRQSIIKEGIKDRGKIGGRAAAAKKRKGKVFPDTLEGDDGED